MILYVGGADAVKEAVSAAARAARDEGRKVGVIDFDGDAEEAARQLFKELRRFDAEKVDVIFAAGVAEEGVGMAVMDRMRQAAGGRIVNV